MKMKTMLLAILTTLSIWVYGQANDLIIPKNINLPKDSILTLHLISSLNGFLSLKEKPCNENIYVLKEDLLETSALLDEMKEIEKNAKLKDNNFYKAYLTNLIKLTDSNFLIQFSYIGVKEDEPELRASFTIIAQNKGKQFYFRSPLKQNTSSWKSQKIGNTKLYFKNKLNVSNAKAYLKTIDQFDQKLKAPKLPTEFYCCDHLNEALRLTGIDYKSDYNGNKANNLSAKENNVKLVVNGTLTADFAGFDPHDIWHSRLRYVLSPSIINRPVDEGTAYLYGGSWGIRWKDILEKFKIFAAADPNHDWMALYNESKNFDEKGKYPLNVDFMINALIIQKLEKEKGFDAVMELLSCGRKEKDNENYYKALEKITGISKSNFNAKVWALIREN